MKLKDYLESKKIKPYHFSQAAGIDKASLSRFLNGKSGLSLDTAARIVKQTSGMVSMDDLLENNMVDGSFPQPDTSRSDGESTGFSEPGN